VSRAFDVIDDVVPYLIVADAPAAISFYISGLGAVEDYRLTMPGGKVGHAELRLGDRRLCVADEFPDEGQVARLRKCVRRSVWCCTSTMSMPQCSRLAMLARRSIRTSSRRSSAPALPG
jgi:uncharacterized glyoxalase superfamily protein PhnB